MATFTLDKDTLVSNAIPIASSPMQVSPSLSSSWTTNKTRLIIMEETDTPGTYQDTTIGLLEKKLKLVQVKPKNYKIRLELGAETDSVPLIVS